VSGRKTIDKLIAERDYRHDAQEDRLRTLEHKTAFNNCAKTLTPEQDVGPQVTAFT
jgi:hypothetical protein